MKHKKENHSKSSLNSILKDLGVNLGIVISKTITAIMTGSGAYKLK